MGLGDGKPSSLAPAGSRCQMRSDVSKGQAVETGKAALALPGTLTEAQSLLNHGTDRIREVF